MLKEEKIKEMLQGARNRVGGFKAYNELFLLGYKTALKDVLEVKRPKAQPANTH